jgi:ATP:corrinoid adenosyltransferase
MPCRSETIDNRIHDVVVCREKLAARRGYLNSNPVIGRNQRGPRFRHIGLTGRSKNKSIYHLMHDT